MDVAFLGLGRMGAPMAGHLLSAGHRLTVWNRTPGRAADLVGRGAREAGSVAAAATGAQAIVLMLTGPDAVRSVLAELLGAAAPGTLLINASTVGPAAAREFAAAADGAGMRYVDAPVAGSVQPARDGTLLVLAGGAAGDVDAARPLLETWGDPERLRVTGPVGTASAYKLVVNLGLGFAAAGLGESLRLAGALGLDRSPVLDMLASGAFGFTLAQKRTMVESGSYQPATFTLDLMAKDLRLAVDTGAELAVTHEVLRAHAAAARAGHGDEDYAVLIGYLEGR